MKPDADDVTRLLALLVAICGEQINSYRPKIETKVRSLVGRHRNESAG